MPLGTFSLRDRSTDPGASRLGRRGKAGVAPSRSRPRPRPVAGTPSSQSRKVYVSFPRVLRPARPSTAGHVIKTLSALQSKIEGSSQSHTFPPSIMICSTCDTHETASTRMCTLNEARGSRRKKHVRRTSPHHRCAAASAVV